jgi:hypothetical protein
MPITRSRRRLARRLAIPTAAALVVSLGKQPSVRGPPLSSASARRVVSGEPTTPVPVGSRRLGIFPTG